MDEEMRDMPSPRGMKRALSMTSLPITMGRVNPRRVLNLGNAAVAQRPLLIGADRKAGKFLVNSAINSKSGGHSVGLQVSRASVADTVIPFAPRSDADRQVGDVGSMSGAMGASGPAYGMYQDSENRSDAVPLRTVRIPRFISSKSSFDPFSTAGYRSRVSAAAAQKSWTTTVDIGNELVYAVNLMAKLGYGTAFNQRIGDLVTVTKLSFRLRLKRQLFSSTGNTDKSLFGITPVATQARISIVVCDNFDSRFPFVNSYACGDLLLPSYTVVYDEAFDLTRQANSESVDARFVQGTVLFPKGVQVRYGNKTLPDEFFPSAVQNQIFLIITGTGPGTGTFPANSSSEGPMGAFGSLTGYFSDQ